MVAAAASLSRRWVGKDNPSLVVDRRWWRRRRRSVTVVDRRREWSELVGESVSELVDEVGE